MEIAELYLNHTPINEIERITGVPRKKLEYLIYHKMGLKRDPIINPKTDRVMYLTKWGYKPHEIAEGEGMKLKTVERILKNGKKQ